MTYVPLLDLKAQYSTIRSEISAAIQRVVESQHFILGPEVEALEREIAGLCNARFAVGVSSGTDALLAALMAIGTAPGDEVITTTYSFFATAGVIARLGARPVFVDIDPKTFNLDPAQVEPKITSRTKAIMPVHLFGQCAAMDPILEIGRSQRHPRHRRCCAGDRRKRPRRKAGGNDRRYRVLLFFPEQKFGRLW